MIFTIITALPLIGWAGVCIIGPVFALTQAAGLLRHRWQRR